ncbi:MAG: [protein-PII] uridylyltransferase [Verrucomicrobiota bacterium]|nr:[protein-PII] uridylyltransferase [Verrucomicrobiota bacterium]
MNSLHDSIQQIAKEKLGSKNNVRKGVVDLLPYRSFLKKVTLKLRTEHRTGTLGLVIVHGRSFMMDQLIHHLFKDIFSLYAHEIPVKAQLAAVAFGGYGRHELNPQSDVDIMILCEGGLKPSGAEPWMEAFCATFSTTLLDLKLKLGYITRNIADCVHYSNEDLKTKTSLIETRLLAGNGPLYLKMQKAMIDKCVLGKEDAYLTARLTDQRARRSKYGNTPFMQEPEIKNGCGGLRDFQNLIWMAFFKYRVKSLEELITGHHIHQSEYRHLMEAYDFLHRVRNEMHYRKNRSEDKLFKSIQPAVAYGLGFKETSPSKRIEAFMQMVYFHMRQIFLLTRQLEESLALDPTPRSRPFWYKIFPKVREEQQTKPVDGFFFEGEWIKASSRRIFREQPRRMMRIFLQAQQRGLRIHPGTAQMMRHSIQYIKKSFQTDEHVKKTFLEILNERGNVGQILRMMHEVGVLGKYMPEFGKLTGMVQHEFFHMYTTDEHTLMCLEHLDRIWDAEGVFHKHYSELFHSLESPHVLYLALLLHDTGKAVKRKGRTHSDVGIDITCRVAERLHLPEEQNRTLALLVRHHLTMAEISQRRDLEDNNEIMRFVGMIGTLERLDMLTLLTFSDSMGTSSELWTGFKESLLWSLYDRARQVLLGNAVEERELEEEKQQIRGWLRSSLRPSIKDDEIEAHVLHMPPRYFRNRSRPCILQDLHLTHRFMWRQVSMQDRALEPIVHWRHDRDRGFSEVDICTWDRPAIFIKFTAALTAAGLNILSARVFSRGDGIVLDCFEVVDAGTGELVKKYKRDKFSQFIKDILTEKVDMDQLVENAGKTPPLYQVVERDTIPTRVKFDNARLPWRTVVEIETEDQVGLLYRAASVFAALNIDLSYAKILTEKGAAIDSFYIQNIRGEKITSKKEQNEISRALTKAMTLSRT